MKKLFLILLILIGLSFLLYKGGQQLNIIPSHQVGEVIDSLDGVAVYYNGRFKNVEGRRVVDGYNVGLKYQCVEFVKRYYLERYNHRMPDSYGHAKSFYNPKVKDGELNKSRALVQFSNPSISKPEVGDLIVLSATQSNAFGHVAIIADVFSTEVELIQQNSGVFSKSRIRIPMTQYEGNWKLENGRVLGWLRITK